MDNIYNYDLQSTPSKAAKKNNLVINPENKKDLYDFSMLNNNKIIYDFFSNNPDIQDQIFKNVYKNNSIISDTCFFISLSDFYSITCDFQFDCLKVYDDAGYKLKYKIYKLIGYRFSYATRSSIYNRCFNNDIINQEVNFSKNISRFHIYDINL